MLHAWPAVGGAAVARAEIVGVCAVAGTIACGQVVGWAVVDLVDGSKLATRYGGPPGAEG